MSQSFDDAVKKLLTQMGQGAGFSCKNEFHLRINGLERYIAYIDHVWLEEVPHPSGLSKRNIPIVAFEITKDIGTLWNMKKMKGDVENLRLSNAALGVLIIPTLGALKDQAKEKGYTGSVTWLANLEGYLKVKNDSIPAKARSMVF